MPVQVLVEDDKLNPADGKQIAEKWMESEHVKLFSGIIFSNVAGAVVPSLAKQAGLHPPPVLWIDCETYTPDGKTVEDPGPNEAWLLDAQAWTGLQCELLSGIEALWVACARSQAEARCSSAASGRPWIRTSAAV